MTFTEEVVNAADSQMVGIDTQLRAFRAVWAEGFRRLQLIRQGLRDGADLMARAAEQEEGQILSDLTLNTLAAMEYFAAISNEMELMQSEMQKYREQITHSIH